MGRRLKDPVRLLCRGTLHPSACLGVETHDNNEVGEAEQQSLGVSSSLWRLISMSVLVLKSHRLRMSVL